MSAVPQRAEDTIIAALLAGFWAGFLMDKLDALTLRLNMPALHTVVQWWPVLLIMAGIAVLIKHKSAPRPAVVNIRPVVVMSRSKEQAHAG